MILRFTLVAKLALTATLAIETITFAPTASATVFFGIFPNPTTTAGAGVSSTRSGPRTWHLYAVDDSQTDLGISSYVVTLTGATEINHRSPMTGVSDENGN